MRRSLVALGVLLLSGFVGDAQEKIQASPEQVRKAALAMFVRNGYSLDSDKALAVFVRHRYSLDSAKSLQLKISKPFTSEETDAYNTAHWTNQPVSNCRHVHAFLFSPEHLATNVTFVSEMVCHRDGGWLFLGRNEKETIQNTLAKLKANIEAVDKRR